MTYEAILRSDIRSGGESLPVLPDLPEPPRIELGALGRSLAFHVRKAQLALQRRGLRNVSEMHVGPAEFGTLVLCEQNPGMAQFQIAAALDIDKAILRRQAEEAESFAHGLFNQQELDQLLGLLARLG